jgi:hypothetical protein
MLWFTEDDGLIADPRRCRRAQASATFALPDGVGDHLSQAAHRLAGTITQRLTVAISPPSASRGGRVRLPDGNHLLVEPLRVALGDLCDPGYQYAFARALNVATTEIFHSDQGYNVAGRSFPIGSRSPQSASLGIVGDELEIPCLSSDFLLTNCLDKRYQRNP